MMEALPWQPKEKSVSKAVDDGVYVSLDTLLDQRHSVKARSKKTTTRVQQGLSGEILSSRKGPGIEFEDIRPYLPGDDLRYIDWRVTARTGVPYTRRYTENLERQVMIVCDQRIGLFFGSSGSFKSYRAAMLAAKMAWLAIEQGHRFSGVVVSEAVETVTVNSPRRAVLEFCNSLANHNNNLGVSSESVVSMGQILQTIHRNLKPGMSVTVISDFSDLDQSSVVSLTDIARRGRLILRRVDDLLEQKLSIHGRVGISDGTQERQVVVSRKVRDSYRKKRELINRQLTEVVSLSGATLLDGDCGVLA